jgi:hypothetical protein
VIVEPVPIPAFDMNECLSDADYLEDCRAVVTATDTPYERYYEEIADRDDGVWTLDLDRLICPYFPICDPVVNGIVVKRDLLHISGEFARSIADEVTTYLEDNRIVSPAA